jgi:plastocyanin
VLDNRLDPTAATVAPGTTVTWTWGGFASHDVAFDDGAASTSMTSGTSTRAVATAGTFDDRCTIHGAAMSGTVVVK